MLCLPFLPSPPDLEIVCFQVSSKPSVTICLVYVPPSSDQQHYFDVLRYLESLAVTYPNLGTLGDFNSPDICWSSMHGQSRTSITLCDLIFHYNLAQLVTFPTHLGGNLLHLVICSPDLSANVSPLSSSLLVSDHYPLCHLSFSIPFVGLQKSSTSWFYNYKKTDFDSLNSFLLDYDFKSTY